MLFEALAQSRCHTVILPGFICPSLSAAVIRAGKRVVHVDVDRDTLMMKPERLEQCLTEHGEDETALLIDHSFGYPCVEIRELRERHPRLLLIEDCVRALGATIDGKPVGRLGDWVLFSLYKTIPGNDNGALLLTRSPCEIRTGPVPRTTLRERLSTFGPARWFYERLRRRHPDYPNGPCQRESMPWEPHFGAPNRLTMKRFAHEVSRLAENVARRREASREIQEALQNVAGLRFIRPGANGQTAGYFLSFHLAEDGLRHRLLTELHRRGNFLVYAWNMPPSSFRCFAETFPFGSSESDYLAERVCHIPVIRYLRPSSRERLIRNIREFFHA